MQPVELTGREYKLLLDPRKFAGAPSDARAMSFWTYKLKPTIRDSLDARNSGESRASGALSLKKQRVVQYDDTGKLLLHRHGFALRRRVFVEDGRPVGVPELTLKFRTPDILLAAAFAERSSALHVEKRKFEEDIAPLQVGPQDSTAKRVARTRSHRPYSRFTVSLYLDFDAELRKLGDAFQRFGPFKDELEDAQRAKVPKRLKLHPGPRVAEFVFENAEVDLGRKRDAAFGLTLWYFVKPGARHWKRAASGALKPDVAEISYDYGTDEGRVDAAVSRRASRLFQAMQETLPVSRKATSKTELALPRRR